MPYSSNHQPSELAFRCRRCGSFNTQYVSVAYSQSVRSGDNGETISKFGKSLAPPKKYSQVLVPSLSGSVAAAWIYGFLLARAAENGDRIFSDDSLIEWPLFGLSLIIGLIVCAGMIARADRLNKTLWEPLVRNWDKEIVCRRCSHRFINVDDD